MNVWVVKKEIRIEMNYHDYKFEVWVVENKLEDLLSRKETTIFKEHNMSFHDLKLFGVMGKAYTLQFHTLVEKYKKQATKGRVGFALRNQIKNLKSDLFRNHGIKVGGEF